ncbi:MAG: hypothetical protein U0Q11_11440 [Vicinamibacterales bacterium]
MSNSIFVRVPALSLLLLLGVAAASVAQPSEPAHPPEHNHAAMESSASTWQVMTDANVFVGFNDQERKFAGFRRWESQNWFMADAGRTIGAGRLRIEGMLSLEPFTIAAAGSPQLFQTGESYRGTPLVNLQHPHDLLMSLGATYSRPVGALQAFVGADLVGSATLGPTAFMHRESARDNPQVPLSHHAMDSTHISAGVVRGGLSRGAFTLEASTFRGAEPDDKRLNIERPRLDSWAVRGRFDSGAWHAQVSGGHLKQPEWYEPYDQDRVTASLGFDGAVKGRPVAVTAVWGGIREFNGFNGNADGYLLEWDVKLARRSALFGRAEVVDKELFGLGYHPKGFSHRHVYFKIDAVTAGYVYDVSSTRWGRVGIGGDATLYRMPSDVADFYGGSQSFHAFVRWRPATTSMHMH